jgi:hypothetical protein
LNGFFGASTCHASQSSRGHLSDVLLVLRIAAAVLDEHVGDGPSSAIFDFASMK